MTLTEIDNTHYQCNRGKISKGSRKYVKTGQIMFFIHMTIKRGSGTAQSAQQDSVVRATIDTSNFSLLEFNPNLMSRVCLVGLPIGGMKYVNDVMLSIDDATAFICFPTNHVFNSSFGSEKGIWGFIWPLSFKIHSRPAEL